MRKQINKIFSRLKSFFKSVFFFYLILLSIGFIIIDENKVREAKVVRILNNLQSGSSPSFLWDMANNKPYETEQIKNTKLYYNTIREFLPQRPEGYGLSGFFAYFEGDTSQAAAYYEKAIQIDPHFFWYYYNLGLIYFKQEQYNKSYNVFIHALKQPVSSVLSSVQNSYQIYGNILKAMPFTNEKFTNHITGAYANCVRLLLESLLRAGRLDETLSTAYNLNDQKMTDKATMLYYTGIAFYLKKEFPKSSILLKEYLQTNPSDQKAGYYLGKSLESMGITDKAQSILQIYDNLPAENSLSSTLDKLQPQPY